ncbi:MAG TPA: hypothetical protein VM736_00275 [Gemmatimonadales bacterium]|nr:hypothetical protein [Gemmatimonadales bacterium]
MIADRATRLLESRWAPLLCGVATALVTWWVWGSLRQVTIVGDEAAYVLQAKVFASGRWTAPGRPLPEFFEQYHVLVTPILASKYWPGHSLLMVPGIWLGLPGLVPVLLSGLTGALCFALARRLANPWVAAVTWFVWTTASGNMRWRASYYSEVTTGALWLVGWWALLDWYETGRRGALLTLAACVGWSAVTRPLTALAFAIPTAVVVLRRCYARRTWRDLGLALALGGVVLGLIPLWSARTTGDWRTTPYVLYARLYFPLTLDTTPERPLPPDMQSLLDGLNDLVRGHTLRALPTELLKRIRQIGVDMWHGWRLLLLPFAIIGLSALPAGASYGVATAASLVLAHLWMAHFPSWSLYYLELQPVLAFLTGLGVGVVAPRLTKRLGVPGSRVTVVLCCSGALALSFLDLRATGRTLGNRQAYFRRFAVLVERIRDPEAIVFVRYSPYHNVNASLIANRPDLDRAHAWIVYDRGADNSRLIALAPSRTPYLYDEATNSLSVLPRATAPHAGDARPPVTRQAPDKNAAGDGRR